MSTGSKDDNNGSPYLPVYTERGCSYWLGGRIVGRTRALGSKSWITGVASVWFITLHLCSLGLDRVGEWGGGGGGGDSPCSGSHICCLTCSCVLTVPNISVPDFGCVNWQYSYTVELASVRRVPSKLNVFRQFWETETYQLVTTGHRNKVTWYTCHLL